VWLISRRGKCNEAVQRSARWEGHLATSNARSLFGFLFALEADFPVFLFSSSLGHGAALGIRFGLCSRRFLFALEADFPVFLCSSTLGHGAALDIRFGLCARRFLFALEADFLVFLFSSSLGHGAAPRSVAGRTQKHRSH